MGRCPSPLSLFWTRSEIGRVARILLLVVVPGQTIFVLVTDAIRFRTITITPVFGAIYVFVALLQVRRLPTASLLKIFEH